MHGCEHDFTIQTLASSGLLLDHHASSFNTQVRSLSRFTGGSEAHTLSIHPSYLPTVPFVTQDPLQNTTLPLVTIAPEAPLSRNNLSELPLFLEILRLKKDLVNIL